MKEKINLKAGIAGHQNRDSVPLHIKPTLKGVINWIKNKKLDPVTEEKMIKKVSRCPDSALENFVKNFQKHVIKSQKINEE